MTQKEKLEQLFKKMVLEIQDYAVILLDIDGNILSWNQGAEKIKGYKEKDIIGKNFRVFYLPKDQQEGLPERLLALAKKEGRATHIGKRVKSDGSTFWGSINLSAIHDDNGEVIGFTKVTHELRDDEVA